MKLILPLLQIILSLLLVTFILLQAKGTGLGSAWGGGGEFYRSKRGVEKIVFYGTVVIAVFFLISSIMGVAIRP